MPCPFCGNPSGHLDSKSVWVTCLACGRIDLASKWGAVSPGHASYPVGSHGAKNRAQKQFGTSGESHQSEHPIGYAVAASGEPRGHDRFAKTVENFMPAYQEEKTVHRDHVGTGTSKEGDIYRKTQRTSLAEGRPGNALQTNQLEYAYQPEFRATDAQAAKRLKTADMSFEQMVTAMNSTPFWDPDLNVWVNLNVTALEKAEVLLARDAARTGLRPGRKEEVEKLKKVGLLPGEKEQPKRGTLSHTMDRDANGVFTDGNCLFHAIWLQMQPQLEFRSVDCLREQAVGYLRIDPDIQAMGAVTDEYLAAMLQPGVWGGALEAFALAYVLGVRIVIQCEGVAGNAVVSFNEAAHQTVSLRYNGSHYTLGSALPPAPKPSVPSSDPMSIDPGGTKRKHD